jgi:hypothetical protein
MKEGFAQLFCINQFLQVCGVGTQNLREILRVNLTVQIFPALQHLAKLTRLRMYYGDHTCCERWIISSVKILLALGATREAMLNDQ